MLSPEQEKHRQSPPSALSLLLTFCLCLLPTCIFFLTPSLSLNMRQLFMTRDEYAVLISLANLPPCSELKFKSQNSFWDIDGWSIYTGYLSYLPHLTIRESWNGKFRPWVCSESNGSIWLNPQTEQLESNQTPTLLCTGHMQAALMPLWLNNFTNFTAIPD